METNKLTFWNKVWIWIQAMDSSFSHYDVVRLQPVQSELTALSNRVRQLEDTVKNQEVIPR